MENMVDVAVREALAYHYHDDLRRGALAQLEDYDWSLLTRKLAMAAQNLGIAGDMADQVLADDVYEDD